MKKETSDKTTRVKGVPEITGEQRDDLRKLAVLPEEEIDYSDIPPVTDFTDFEVGKFYRPVKETVTVRLDSDVLYWLKQGGKGYQSRLNAILRKEMTAQSRRRQTA
jgi:uncharacterized protein (DUF4415 family)